MTTKVSFILPTKNEEKTIGQVIDKLIQLELKGSYNIVEIIVTDDSNDNTKKIAKAKGANVICGGGLGLGEAMYRGLKKAYQTKADLLISLDTDGQTNLDEIETMIEAVDTHQADLILSSRFKKKGSIEYKYPFINRQGVRILILFLRYGSKLPLTDSHGGIRVMKPAVAKSLEMIGIHTYVQETIFDAAQKGFKIIELEGKWKERMGESRVLASIPKYIAYTLPVIILRLGLHIKIGIPIFILLAIISTIIILFLNYTLGTILILFCVLGIFHIYIFEYLQTILKNNRDHE